MAFKNVNVIFHRQYSNQATPNCFRVRLRLTTVFTKVRCRVWQKPSEAKGRPKIEHFGEYWRPRQESNLYS